MRSTILVLIFAWCVAAGPAHFQYIVVEGTTLRSANGVPVEVRAPSGFRVLAPTSRNATFEGHPYEVSLAALASENAVVMFHAERVADDSGASNYDNLPGSPWAGFKLRSQCAPIAAADVAEEHDLRWLADRGWNPVGNLALEQHLKTTADHNREVVVTLAIKVKSCTGKQKIDAALARFRSQIRLESD